LKKSRTFGVGKGEVVDPPERGDGRGIEEVDCEVSGEDDFLFVFVK